MTSPSDSISRYCRKCGYNLQALAQPRCPECGRAFDPANPRTVRARPPRRWVRPARRFLTVVFILMSLLGGTWGWFYMGWRKEQHALAALDVRFLPGEIKSEPLFSDAFQRYLGPAGFVLDRVRMLHFQYNPKELNIVDFSPLADLRELRELILVGTRAPDLKPLAGLVHLKRLELTGLGVGLESSDLSPLEKLTDLEELDIGMVIQRVDIGPVAGCMKLRVLRLNGMAIQSLSPLAGLTNLKTISLRDTNVTDIHALAELSQLEELEVVQAPLEELPQLRLAHLRKLDLQRTLVRDVTPLADLHRLEDLNLAHTQVTHIAPLAACDQLKWLDVTGTPVTDLNALSRLSHLTILK